MEKNYYLSRNYREEGPYSLEHIRLMQAAGQLGNDVYAREDGEGEWQPLSSVLAANDTSSPAHPAEGPSLSPPSNPSAPLPAWRSVKGWGIAIRSLLLLSMICLVWIKIEELEAYEVFQASQEGSASFDESLDTFYASLAHVEHALPFIDIIGLITAVISLVWLYRCAINANRMAWQAQRTLSMASPIVKPGNVVYSFFIPIYNLFKPYANVKRIYNVSNAPEDTRVSRFSWLVSVWWVSFLAKMIYDRWSDIQLNRLVAAAETDEDYLQMLHDAFDMELTLNVIQVVSIISYYILVRRVSTWQGQAMQAGPDHPSA